MPPSSLRHLSKDSHTLLWNVVLFPRGKEPYYSGAVGACVFLGCSRKRQEEETTRVKDPLGTHVFF